ncbi:HalOD1 output domain-containing protein [Halopiger thermotolerans]
MQSGEQPSVRVAEAIAAAEGVDPVDLEPPLYDAIDPDALDSLADSLRRDAARSHEAAARVEFTYRTYRIEVEVGNEVDVTLTERASNSGFDSATDSRALD